MGLEEVREQADIGRLGRKIPPELLYQLSGKGQIGRRGQPVPPELLQKLGVPAAEPSEVGERDKPVPPRFLERLKKTFASKRLVNEPTVGHRQPYPHEVQAAVDWPLMQSAWQSATVQLIARWKLVRAAQAAELAELVQVAVGAGDPGALAGLVATTRGADELYDSMERMLRTSAAQAVAEARAQGVVMGELDIAPMLPALRRQAESLAFLEAKALSVSAANQALLRFGTDADARRVAEYVYDHLLGLSDKGLQDTLGGALTQAQNAARAYVIGNGPEVSRIYASEILDQNTCPKCAAVDGTEYPDIEAAMRDYPVGPYFDCDGWARCRGTLVAVYDETPATIGDDNVPDDTTPDPVLEKLLVSAHLPGQHDQSSHNPHGGGATLVRNFEITDNIGALSDDERAQIEKGLGRIQAKIGPEATEGVRVKVGFQGQPGSFAWVKPSPYTKEITLSPWYLNNPKGKAEFAREFPALRKSGHFIDVAADVAPWEYIVVHEMGHILEGTQDAVANMLIDSGRAFDMKLSDSFPSKYAAKNVHELVAESFTDYVFNDSPSADSNFIGIALQAGLEVPA